MNITDLFPAPVRGMITDKALQLFESQDGNPAPYCFVLQKEQSTDEAGNKLFFEKGRQKGQPIYEITATPYLNDIRALNQNLYDDLTTANNSIIAQNKRIEADALQLQELRKAYNEMKHNYLMLLNEKTE